MRTTRFKVLSQEEVECIHSTSMEVLATVGGALRYLLRNNPTSEPLPSRASQEGSSVI